MGIRDRYDHGIFSWVDLMTPRPESAKQFYSSLFNWTFEDRPVDGGPPYSMALKGDRTVSALFAMPEEQAAQQIPPHWQAYINVDDLEATVQRWQSQGGSVLVPPCTVMTAGRMAVLQDPVGAVVNLWQAQDYFGAERVNEVNTFCWTELQTWHPVRAADFYQAVFGWQYQQDEAQYITCTVSDRPSCGIFDLNTTDLPQHIPANWIVYFNVANLDATIAQVQALGGTVLMEAIDVGPGRLTTIQDPQGAVFAIIELTAPDD